MKLDFSKYGLKEGLIKAAKIVGWVAGSGAITALIAEVSKYEPKADQVYAVAAVLVVNAILAGAKTWLETHKPTK